MSRASEHIHRAPNLNAFSRRWRKSAVMAFGVLVVAGSCIALARFLAVREPRQMSMIARDWRSISFTTEINGPVWESEYPPFNMVGGGTFTAETQLVEFRAWGNSEDPDQPNYALDITASGAEATVIRVSGWVAGTFYDEALGRYYVQLTRTDSGATIKWDPPFDKVPQQLADQIAYQLPLAGTLDLRLPTDTDCCRNPNYSVEVIAGDLSALTWYMRRGCEVLLQSRPVWHTAKLRQIDVEEICPDTRRFNTQEDERADMEAAIVFDVNLNRGYGWNAVLIPRSVRIHSAEQTLVPDTGSDYLILLRSSGMHSIVSLRSTPRGKGVSFGVYPSDGSDIPVGALPLIGLRPSSHQINATGLRGRFALGTKSFSTDEMSDVVFDFVDWPAFEWREEFLVSESGLPFRQALLSTRGVVSRLSITGEQLILSRWENLSPEIQGAVFGGIMAALVSIGVALVESYRRARADAERLVDISQSCRVANAEAPAQDMAGNSIRLILMVGVGLVFGILLIARRSRLKADQESL